MNDKKAVEQSGNEDSSLLRYDAVSTGIVTDVSVGRDASILNVCTLDRTGHEDADSNFSAT
jgi:hypothetical protein